MEYRLLGNTGLRVSALGFGTMSFGGDASAETAAALFAACRDAGVNLFDCADLYGAGVSEQILGKLVSSCRDEVVLTTKAYFPTGEDPNARGSSRYHLVRAVEASLKRLGTDRVDIFFLHRFDPHTALDETLRALEDLVRAGKILYPAVSNFAAWQTEKALGVARLHGWSPIVATQPMYNLVKRQAEVEILPMAADAGLAVFPYSPLGGGLLTGKYGRKKKPQQGRLVESKMYASRYADERGFETARRFMELARERELDPVGLAIAWVASHPAVTAPLIGARSVEQLGPALASVEIKMHDELRHAISELSDAPPLATDRSEERR